MKKLFFLTILLAGVLYTGARPVTVSAATCPLRTDVPYRSWSRSAVFYVTADCRRQPIKNPDVYFSYFLSWNEVRYATDDLLYTVPRHPLAFLPWGPRRHYDNGSLMKVVSNDTVYLLAHDQLFPIGSEEVFYHLHLRFEWVEDVAPSVLSMFPLHAPLVAITDYPEQFAFKYAASSTVYTLEKAPDGTTVKRPVPSYDVLQSFYRPDHVVIFPADQTYPDAGSASVSLPTPPSPPGSLRLISSDGVSVTIGWNDRSINESSFEIERQDGAVDASFREYESVPANTTLFTDTNVRAGHTYLYRVRAVNAGGSSYVSSVIQGSVSS